jgi:hypothetical protein
MSSSSLSAWDEIYYVPLSKSWGAPPWNIFMMVNILPTSKQTSSKRTEIRIHSNPATVESVQNALYPASHQIWKVIMIIGPFYNARRALDLFIEWSSRSRGCKSRINIGINIFQKNYKRENLILYVIKKKRPDLIRDLGNHPNIANPIWAWGEQSTEQKLKEFHSDDLLKEEVDTVLQKWWHHGSGITCGPTLNHLDNNNDNKGNGSNNSLPIKLNIPTPTLPMCNKTLGWVNNVTTNNFFELPINTITTAAIDNDGQLVQNDNTNNYTNNTIAIAIHESTSEIKDMMKD